MVNLLIRRHLIKLSTCGVLAGSFFATSAQADCIRDIREARRMGTEGGRQFCHQVERNFVNEMVAYSRAPSPAICEIAQVIVCKTAFAQAVRSRSLCNHLVRTNWQSDDFGYATADLYRSVQKGVCNLED